MDITTYEPLDLEKLSMPDLEPLHAVLDADMTEKQREFVEVIYVGLLNSAASHVCSVTELAQTAMAVLLQVGHTFGGHTYYVTKIENLRLAKKYRAIWAKFNGRNHTELAIEFGITEMRVRQILAHKARTK